MTVGINTIGTLSYNGYSFDGTSKVTCRVEYVKDRADRVTIYQRTIINVKATIASGNSATNTADVQMDSIKFRLSQQGAGLIFINRGFGTGLSVNVPGGARDVKFGPKPRILSWSPIGSNRAVEIEWEVETCVAMCNGSGGMFTGLHGVLAWNYEADYSVNSRGFTQRVISGYIEIVATADINGRLNDTADRMREQCAVSVPEGFDRESNWHVNLDKSTLDFRIVDTQIESKFPFPKNIVHAQGTHRVTWSRSNRGAMTLRNTISMRLEPAWGMLPTHAYFVFGSIVKQRIEAVRKEQRGVLIDDLVIEEDIWGTASSFSVSYRVLASLKDLLAASGIWQPIGTNWKEWHATMRYIHDVRGHAGLRHNVTDDIIMSLCSYETKPVNQQTEKTTTSDTAQNILTKNVKPPKEHSYLYYEQSIVPIRSRPVSRQSTIQEPDYETSSGDMESTGGVQYNKATPGSVSDTLQLSGQSRYRVLLVGRAARAGYEVPRPSILKVGDRDAVEKHGIFAQKIVGNYLGVPVYAAWWKIQYELSASPGRVLPPSNVMDKVSSDGNITQ